MYVIGYRLSNAYQANPKVVKIIKKALALIKIGCVRIAKREDICT